ncbi:glycosyltransferase [Ligilactobacillus aviarius]|uniref:glycosyltransferase n=1 Tax=Ligilactobacillus aviarius TaxID=1606 RepID=UPI00388FCEB5
MTKLGVIVAAYNVENEILRCLESLHNQNFEDAQFIIVNDGSTDGTKNVIADYISNSNDKRFVFFDKTNNGISSTRNYGLQKANSDYVMFVDGDDALSDDQDFLYKISNIMDKDSLDILEFNYDEKNDKGKQKKFTERKSTQIISGTELFYESIYNDRFDSYVWHYVYRLNLLKDNVFWFKENTYIEDVLFIIPVLLAAKKAKYVDEIGYTYIRRNNSITNNSNVSHRKKLVKDHISVLEKVNQNIENTPIDSRYIERIDNLLARAFMVNVIKAKGYNIPITRNEINGFLKNKKLTKANQIKKEVILGSPQFVINALSKLMIKIFP